MSRSDGALSGIKHVAGLVLQALGMGVLAFAGASKLMDLPAFGKALQTWGVFSREAMWVLMLVVPAVELLLAAAWFARVRPRTVVVASMVVIAGFSVAYAWAWWAGFHPDCGCLGKILAMENAKKEVWPIVARNGGLELILGVSLWLERGRHANGQASAERMAMSATT